MAIANYIVEYSDLEQLWFVVSPQNPLKDKKSLLADYQRLELVNLAINNDTRFMSSNIEFTLPKPSYTIDTLIYLHEKYPTREFCIIMGSDNILNIHKWKNYEKIISDYEIIVYPRPDFEASEIRVEGNINIINAPNMEISSSFIRKSIKEGKKMNCFLPGKVFEYLDEMNFYK